jgi:hypothetical protein
LRIRDLIRHAAVLPILAYRRLISPLLPPSCIYAPSCSSYAQTAILRHGILAGTILAITRVSRCASAFFAGGDDPVPEAFSFAAAWASYRRFYRKRSGRIRSQDAELPESRGEGTMDHDGGPGGDEDQ